MKRTSVLALSVVCVIVCGFPVITRGAADAAATPASILSAREIAGGFPCRADHIHNIDLGVTKGTKDVQVKAANKAPQIHIGDCVNWRAVVTDGSGKATVTTVNFTGQAGKTAAKSADVCDYTTPAEQCLVGIGFQPGEYAYQATVNHGGIRKTSDTLKIVIVPCLLPNCEPNPFEKVVAIRASVHK